MEKLIFRKLLKDILANFAILLISLSIIVWVIQAVNFLDFVSEDGHGFKVYFLYTLFSFPKIFSKLFMLVFFISFFYMLLKYEEKNELIIFWTIGISKIEFVKIITKFSLLLILALIILNSIITPYTQDNARSYIRGSNIDFFPSLIKERKFIDTVSNLTIYVGEKSKDEQTLKKIYLKELSKSNQKFRIIIAKEGNIAKKNDVNIFIFRDGEILNYDENNNYTSFKFENFEFDLSGFTSKTTTIPKVQEVMTSTLIKCLLNINYNKKFEIDRKRFLCNDEALLIVNQELLKRFYLPLFFPLVCLVALMLILRSNLQKTFTRYKIFVFIIGFFIIFISEISINYAGKNLTVNYLFFLIPVFLYCLLFSIFFKENNKIAVNS
jgi:lipopolysaccharide export system permease protein